MLNGTVGPRETGWQAAFWTPRSLASRVAILVLVVAALAIRWGPLTGRDLYNDEALQTTINRSFLEDGSLNNFRYSSFTSPSEFHHGVWAYYPPGFNLIQALFLAFDPTSATAARLPVLVLNLIVLAWLPSLSRMVWKRSAPGWVAAILAALGPFHVSMSVTGLTYPFVAPLLVLAFGAFIMALRRKRGRNWIGVGLLVAFGFYVTPIALSFCALLGVTFAWSILHRRADVRWGVSIAAGMIGVLCVPWMIWARDASSSLHSFMTVAPGYSFGGQAALVLIQYDLMLPSLFWKLAFIVGLAVVARHAAKPDGLPGALLGMWALAPLLYMFARNMWVTPRHVFAAYAAVMILTGLGMTTAIRRLAAFAGSQVRGSTRPAIVAVVGTVLVAGAQFMLFQVAADPQRPYRPMDNVLRGDAAIEFGEPDIVSRASAYIKEHDGGEPVIAPVGISEAHYLGRFVHDKRTAEAVARAWTLARSGPAWVFMGDNYFRLAALDDFDRAVQQHGRLITQSAPVRGFTVPENTAGYALYYLDRPLPPP